MNAVLPKGIYQHYKGDFYEVIDVARHTETLEEMAVYRALYGDFELWVRPLQMFLEHVEIAGVSTPRFKLMSSENAKINYQKASI